MNRHNPRVLALRRPMEHQPTHGLPLLLRRPMEHQPTQRGCRMSCPESCATHWDGRPRTRPTLGQLPALPWPGMLCQPTPAREGLPSASLTFCGPDPAAAAAASLPPLPAAAPKRGSDNPEPAPPPMHPAVLPQQGLPPCCAGRWSINRRRRRTDGASTGARASPEARAGRRPLCKRAPVAAAASLPLPGHLPRARR